MVMAASNASLASSDENILAEQGEVFGSYIDEVLCMVKANGDRFYYHLNDLFSVYALTDSTGTVVERYFYDPYGQTHVLDGNGAPTTSTISSTATKKRAPLSPSRGPYPSP